MKNKKIISAGLIFIVFIVFYFPLDNLLKKAFDSSQEAVVERIIDGDTIKTSEGETIRLLGINTPEKGEKYSQESKLFLENEILNKSIILKFGEEKNDLYGRTLAYVFTNGKNINGEMIANGFANPYFPSGKDAYASDFFEEWKNCVQKDLNYCKKSKNICANCIELKELSFENQRIVLKNVCGIECNLTFWEIKDEGRKKFTFSNTILKPNEETRIIVGKEWSREDYVWTETGDTFFLRDEKGMLVLWKNY